MKKPQKTKQKRVKQIKRIKRIRKWKKRSLIVLCLFIFLSCFLVALIYTSLGIKLVTQVLEKVIPEIQLEQTDGTLNDLKIQGFKLDMDGVEVFIGRAELSLSGLCLIEGKICVKSLNAQDVTVNIKTDEFQQNDRNTSPDQPLLLKDGRLTDRFIVKMPLPLVLRSATLSNIAVNVGRAVDVDNTYHNGRNNDNYNNYRSMHFALSTFKGSATWINEKIYVFPATAMNVKAIFPDKPTMISTSTVSTKIASTNSIAKNLVAEAKNPFQSVNKVINDIFNRPLIASLPEVSIPLDIYVNNLTGTDWLLHIGGEDYFFNDVSVRANIENNFITAKLVQANAKTPYVNGNIAVTGNITLGGDWPLVADIQAKTQPVSDKQSNQTVKKQIATEITGHIDGQLLGTLSTKTKITGLNQVNVAAKVNFIEKYMPVTVSVKGEYVQWPITGSPRYKLNHFDLELSGSVNNYHLNAKGNFYGNDLPATGFEIASTGSHEFIDIKHVTVSLPQGEFDLSGKLSWFDKLKWHTHILFKKIDLSQQIPHSPIKLDGNVTTHGEADSHYWLANLTETELKGDINGAPLQVSGSAVINSKQFISADHFSVKWGDNLIKLNGSSKHGDLVVDLNMTDLAVIAANLRGKITGQLIVNGSIDQPAIESHLNIANFVWQNGDLNSDLKDATLGNIVLKQAQLTGKVKYTDMLQADVKLKAREFALLRSNTPRFVVRYANVGFSGDERNHNLTVEVEGKVTDELPAQGEAILAVANLTGSLNKARTKWQGKLSEAVVSLNNRNNWQLDKSIQLSLDLQNLDLQKDALPKNNPQNALVNITAHCWVNSRSKICLDKDVILASRGEVMISLIDIDLGLFKAFSGEETQLAGTLHGQANIKWDPKYSMPLVEMNVDSRDVYVRQRIASQMLPIPFDLFSIKGSINDKQAKFDWQFSIKEFGQFSGDVQIDDPMDKKRLSGQLSIDELSLSIINPLLNDNEHASGIINSHLTFSGSLLDPHVIGNLALAHSEIKSTQLPFDVSSVMMNIDFTGKSSRLIGQMQTENGRVNIEGLADWQNLNDWRAYVTLKGAAIEVSMPPLLTLSAIPDIKIEADQDKLDLTGQVSIPKASLKVESLAPSAVTISSDEVMINNDLQAVLSPNRGMKINSQVRVTLGNNVAVDTFGLIAKLKGDVDVIQNNKGLTVNGQISVLDGRFHAYGQDLIVRNGDIIFAGPADQARLNIEAIRNPQSIEDNVTAGIRVTGLAENPEIKIFSDPVMSEQETLSYLLRGQGLNSEGQNDNDMLTALLIGMGTAQTGRLVGDIGGTFGIRNLTLDTQGAGDSQKVVVSGYILPHLQLKYGVGIFDSLATFTLRYRLLPRLYLEAVSGLDRTVDLIYQFEF